MATPMVSFVSETLMTKHSRKTQSDKLFNELTSLVRRLIRTEFGFGLIAIGIGAFLLWQFGWNWPGLIFLVLGVGVWIYLLIKTI